jgi:hypothetical protein
MICWQSDSLISSIEKGSPQSANLNQTARWQSRMFLIGFVAEISGKHLPMQVVADFLLPEDNLMLY